MTTLLSPPRLVLADDHRLILDAVGHLLSTVATVVGTATDGVALLEVVETTRPDVVITDVSMPGLNGLEVTRALRARPDAPRVIILTIHADPAVARSAFAAGASGYVVKNADAHELRAAIEAVCRGERYLSPVVSFDGMHEPSGPSETLTDREREVLDLVAQGLTARAIGERLGIGERTVNFHKKNLKSRLGVGTTAQAVAWLMQQRHGARVQGGTAE
jgi:DNA-binding NarL/FixJ family response regulator